MAGSFRGYLPSESSSDDEGSYTQPRRPRIRSIDDTFYDPGFAVWRFRGRSQETFGMAGQIAFRITRLLTASTWGALRAEAASRFGWTITLSDLLDSLHRQWRQNFYALYDPQNLSRMPNRARDVRATPNYLRFIERLRSTVGTLMTLEGQQEERQAFDRRWQLIDDYYHGRLSSWARQMIRVHLELHRRLTRDARSEHIFAFRRGERDSFLSYDGIYTRVTGLPWAPWHENCLYGASEVPLEFLMLSDVPYI